MAAALGVPTEVAPLWHRRQVLLELGEHNPTAAREAAERMDTSLGTMGPDGVLEHQIMGHYDLAKFWLGQGEHKLAFRHWQAGHALLRRFQPFSREQHADFIDANITLLDRGFFERSVWATNRDAAPVFIVGMPRSGTTLCESIISAHRNVFGAGERTALGRLFGEIGGARDDGAAVSRIAGLDAQALETAAETYLADLHALAPTMSRIVDKMPENYLYLGLVARLLPVARIIHCLRDPRDFGLSIFTSRFHGSHGYAHDLGDLGWTIAQHGRFMAGWREALPNPIISVRLSDWIEIFHNTVAGVLEFLELPHDPKCERFYDTEQRVRTVSRTQVRQPINGHGLGRWRTYHSELEPMLAELTKGGMDWFF